MFGKIFEQIYDSSIAEDWQTRIVFQDFIVLADINGVVDRTPESISRRTNVPLQIVQEAIAKLEGPDPHSRSTEENGARIRRLDPHRSWGWEIVNYERYRAIASDEQRRENTRNRTRKWRTSKNLQNSDAPVTQCDAGDAMQKQKQKQMEEYNGHHPMAVEVLEFLNAATGRRYRPISSNLKLISCRLKEPEVDLVGVKAMIMNQVKEWKGTEMDKYLRPETLFNKTKFDGYYANREAVIPERPKRYVPNL